MIATHLGQRTFNLQELLLLNEGTKPVLRYAEVNSIQTDRFKADYEKEKLCFLIKEFKKLYNTAYPEPIKIVYISKSRTLAEKAYAAEKNGDRKKLGELLGYPECCVNFFLGHLVHKQEIPFLIQTFLRTKGKSSFYSNNIYNPSARASGHEKLFENQEWLKRRNRFLIPHVPCSYTCKKSIKIGKTAFRLLKGDVPEFLNEIVSSLKHVFLVFGEFEFVAMKGNVNGNEIKYSEAIPVNLDQKAEKAFKEGNEIIVYDNNIEVLRDGIVIQKIEKKSKYDVAVLDFT